MAHRGASARHPENTLEAFEAAVAAGADIVELDVRRCADGGLVVIHDPTFASASGTFSVSELTLRQIKRIQPQIPSLDDVLEHLRGRVGLEVEIKNAPHEAGYEPSGRSVVCGVVAALRRQAFTDAFVASFDSRCLQSVKELDPGIGTGLLAEPSCDLDLALETAAGRHAVLLPEASVLETAGKTFIDRAHDRGLRLCAWTADDAATIGRLFELGVDAVETNDPALGAVVRDRIRNL